MTKPGVRLLTLFLASASTESCGTILSRTHALEIEMPIVYGGVVHDAGFLAAGTIALAGPPSDYDLALLVIPLTLVDLPLSLVADTLLLPLTIPEGLGHDADVAAFRGLLAAIEHGNLAAARNAFDGRSRALSMRNDQRDSALDLAARKGDLPIVEFLVASGADPCAMDGKPLQEALFAGQHGVALWLHDSEAGRCLAPDDLKRTLLRAVDGDHPEAVGFVFKQGWLPVDGPVELERSLLEVAARNGKVDSVRAALDAGADVNHAEKNGFTALHGAVWGDRPDVVRLLISRGADVDAVHHERSSWLSSCDRTPLSTALDFHQDEIATLLRDAGAHEPSGAPH